MSTGTNQERLEQNNSELENIKSNIDIAQEKVNNLPENIPAVPIISNINYNVTEYEPINLTGERATDVAYQDGYTLKITITYRSSNYYTYLQLLDKNNNNILYSIDGQQNNSLVPQHLIIDFLFINDKKIVFYYGSSPAVSSTKSSPLYIYSYDIETKICKNLFTQGIAAPMIRLNNNIFGFESVQYGSDILYKYTVDNYIGDVTKEQINYALLNNKGQVNEYFYKITNNFAISKYNYSKFRDLVDGKECVNKIMDTAIFGITYKEDKIIMDDNNLYTFYRDTLTIGDLLKENVFINYPEGECLICISPELYITNTGRLYSFDDNENIFNDLGTITGTNFTLKANGMVYQNNNKPNLLEIVKDSSDAKIIGYTINNSDYFLPGDKQIVSLKSENILAGYKVYNQNGESVIGTMQNNGEVTALISNKEQILNKGYYKSIKIPAIVGTKDFYSIIGKTSYTVENIDTAQYNFELNDTGYYESKNKGQNNSYAICKVIFNFEQSTDVIFDVISSGENNFDYGIFSKLDTELSLSYKVDDNSKIEKSYKSLSSKDVQYLTYTIPEGEHFIYIKFIKDSGTSEGNDTLQFKVQGVVLFNIYTNTNLNNITDMSKNDIANIYDLDTNIMTKYKYTGSDWVLYSDDITIFSDKDTMNSTTAENNDLAVVDLGEKNVGINNNSLIYVSDGTLLTTISEEKYFEFVSDDSEYVKATLTLNADSANLSYITESDTGTVAWTSEDGQTYTISENKLVDNLLDTDKPIHLKDTVEGMTVDDLVPIFGAKIHKYQGPYIFKTDSWKKDYNILFE